MYRLIFQEGPFKGKRLTVQQGTVVIGRDPDSHIHIPDDKISWRHAAIEEREDGGVYIRDMGSLNKITVNGTDVREARLSNTDHIVIGRTAFTYQKIQAVVNEQARKVNYVQRITFSAVITILVVQAIFLIALALWRFGAISGQALLPGGEVDTNIVAKIVAKAEQTEQPAPPPEKPKQPVVKATPTPSPTPEKKLVEAKPAPTPELIPVIPDIPIQTENKEIVSKEQEPVPQPTASPEVVTPKTEIKKSEPAAQPAPPVETAQIDLPAKQPAMQFDSNDPLMEIAREMMEEAKLEISKHNYVQADQQLERVQIVCPDYFPAYAERAKLYEKRAMLTEAGEEWADLLRRATGTSWHEYAAHERARVARAEMLKNNIKAPVINMINKKTAPSELPENIRIDAVKRQTFDKTREYDKMRILTITVRQNIDNMDINGEAVEVKVYFYDKIKGTGKVTPTQAVVPEEAITFSGLWPPDERRTVTAAYIVPKDFRRLEQDEFGTARTYYGYVVEVYYEGILQDVAARPKNLLKLID